MAQAIYVISAAVDRYKELCEGRYVGQAVPRAQRVLGVEFSYQPPPKSTVPYAASLKGTHHLGHGGGMQPRRARLCLGGKGDRA